MPFRPGRENPVITRSFLRNASSRAAIFLTIPHPQGTSNVMEELDTDDSGLPLASTKEPANPEIASVKRVLTLLDKTAKSSRTYGTTNPVAQKFFQQLFESLVRRYPESSFSGEAGRSWGGAIHQGRRCA